LHDIIKEVLSKFVPSITQPTYMYTVEITALMTFIKRPVISIIMGLRE